MSKEEYAEEINPFATYYEKGRRDERNRILKLIDEKIKWSNSTPKYKLDKAIKNKELDEIFYRGFHEGFDEALKELKDKLNAEK